MMADTNELQTTRIDGSVDDGIDLAAKWPNFEAAVRNIFGVPADTVLSESMTIATDGDVTMTGDLTLSGAPIQDLQAATKAYLISQASTVGNIRARAYMTLDQTITGGGGNWVDFDVADINEGTLWEAPNPSRMTIPEGGDGHYLVGASASYDSASGETRGLTRVVVNRSDTYDLIYEDQGLTGEVAVSGLHLIQDLEAGDYIELNIFPRASGSATVYADNTTLWLFNLT